MVNKKSQIYYLYCKYFIDKIAAFFTLIILSPILILISLILIFTQDRKFIFSQRRPGYKTKIFNIYKFKTMNNLKDNNGILLPDTERITNIGNILRKTSLDELPSLINILKGEMSFVGPRPLLVEYLKEYTPLEMQRHNLKPGLTGLAQSNGRNNSSWEKRLNLDVCYVENVSLLLDLKILLNTIRKVISRDGVNQSANTTMPLLLRKLDDPKIK